MIYKLTTILLLAVSPLSHAEFIGPGSKAQSSTVESVKQLDDDARVSLEGYLIREVRPEHYIFKDDTGEIEVEIDTEDFRGLKVTPDVKIHFLGEVDKSFFSDMTLEADTIELAK